MYNQILTLNNSKLVKNLINIKCTNNICVLVCLGTSFYQGCPVLDSKNRRLIYLGYIWKCKNQSFRDILHPKIFWAESNSSTCVWQCSDLLFSGELLQMLSNTLNTHFSKFLRLILTLASWNSCLIWNPTNIPCLIVASLMKIYVLDIKIIPLFIKCFD